MAKSTPVPAPIIEETIEETIEENEAVEAKLKILIDLSYFHNDGFDEQKFNKYEVLVTHKENNILHSVCDISENCKSDLTGEIVVDFYNVAEMSDLIDNPLLVLVSETVHPLIKKGSIKTSVTKYDDKPLLAPLGYSNLDLYPLLNGNDCIEETLILHPLKSTVEKTTWPNLPTIMIRARIEKSDNCEDEFFHNLNMITITMEHLCDVPARVTLDYDCSIYTIVPRQNEVFQEMTFLKGTECFISNVETVKKWATLSQLEGRGNTSKHPVSTKILANRNRIPLTIFSDEEVHLIEWNSFHCCFTDENDNDILKQYVTKNRCWPLEMLILPKSSQHSGKSTGRKKDGVVNTPIHLMAFPDVSRLLYPGEVAVRVAAAVYIYNEEYMLWRGGMQSFVLEPTNIEPVPEPLTENVSSTTLYEPQCEEFYDENGKPVYVIMEIELLHPLVKKKILTNIYEDIHKLLPVRKIDIVFEKSQSAKKKYHQCVKDSVVVLNEEYAKFLKASKTFSSKVAGDDETSAFIRYLHTSGVYSNILSVLIDNVIHLIDDNCKLGESIESEDDHENFISRVFIELVSEMHKALMVPKSKVFVPAVDSKDLLYFAREEEALKHYKEAENLHLQRISLKKEDADVWFDYSIFCLSTGQCEKAYVAVCEVLQLDFHHRLGLLLCGVLLMYKGLNTEAENFLIAVMTMYPKFFEAYIASHLFFKIMEKFDAADVTLDIAKSIISNGVLCLCNNMKCLCERDPFMIQEEFVWYDRDIPKKKTLLRATGLFIRLRLFEFAEMILAEELVESGPSLLYDYLLATIHYFQAKYPDALKHLQQEGYQADGTYLISSLEGHCLLSLDNPKPAYEAFEYTNLCFDRPNDVHLVYIRLGQYYLNTEKYEKAKNMFITCCNYSPTPNTWLGAGIAFLKLEMFNDCEKCLIEANFLNRHNPLVWAYLAILNIHFSKEVEFKKCFTMAVKNGLTDEALLMEIQDLSAVLLPEEYLDIQSESFVFY